MSQNKLSPAEKARLFAMATRQNIQLVASKTGAVSSTVSFELPKARLLSRLFVEVKTTVSATHASKTDYVSHQDSPFNFLSKVQVNLNNGFSPFDISGKALYAYNIANRGIPVMTRATSGNGSVVQGLTAGSTAVVNTVRILAELPVAVNQRDPIGYILLQNPETLCTVDVQLGALADLAPASTGYTFAIGTITVNLYAETFSIPAIPEALPDLSILKVVHEKTESVIAGENTIKLPVGLTYRKLFMIQYDATPTRELTSDITGTIDLILNQADYPYRVQSTMLSEMNSDMYGGAMPDGIYCFDFSAMQGQRNLSGGRDYIDTESLTEFWLRFTSGTVGTVKVFYEALSKLR